MNPGPALTLLKNLLMGIIQKLPDIALAKLGGGKSGDQQFAEEFERLRTDMHYYLAMVERMQTQFAQMQKDTLDRQVDIIQALIVGRQRFIDQWDTLNPAGVFSRATLQGDRAGRERLTNFIAEESARRPADFQRIAELSSPEDMRDTVERLVRQQMTYLPDLRGNPGSARKDEWRVLAYHYAWFIYYIAVNGDNPADAQIRYLRSVPERIPHDDASWASVRRVGVERFETFTFLPGAGIYDLATRMAANGVNAD